MIETENHGFIVAGNIVRLIVDHPEYLAGEKQVRLHGRQDAYLRPEERCVPVQQPQDQRFFEVGVSF